MDDLRQLTDILMNPKGRRRVRKTRAPQSPPHDPQHESPQPERVRESHAREDASAQDDQIPVLTVQSPHGTVRITVSRDFFHVHQDFIHEITGVEREISRHVWGY